MKIFFEHLTLISGLIFLISLFFGLIKLIHSIWILDKLVAVIVASALIALISFSIVSLIK